MSVKKFDEPICAEIGKVLTYFLSLPDAKRGTKYFSPHFVVSFQRRSFQRSKIIEIHVKIGAPNFAERLYIKQCKKAREGFTDGIQLKFFSDPKTR